MPSARTRTLPPIRLSEQEAAECAEVARLRRLPISTVVRLLVAEELARLKAIGAPQ